MELDRYPLVSVGVPVFNGEDGLSRCLEGLLRQDYPNLEIIISDNASTDATPSICERFARSHRRITYSRSVENRGAIWNFNRVFELSSGTYFMWAAHDDDREPSFVSACVEQLERFQDAVLCQAHTAVCIEGREETLYVASLDTFERKPHVVERYREALERLPSIAFYGVYRSSAMRKTKLLQPVIATDLSFVHELAIHGRFVQVPDVLFRYSGRESWNTIDQDARHFLGRPKPWWYVPSLMLFIDDGQRVASSAISLGLKIRLLTVLAMYQGRQFAVKVLLKIARAICPAGRKERLGRAMYQRWIRNPNVEIANDELFFRRVCKPQLGWWK
jgi:glycosyltransferase involved in cell wall biosynthesis